MRKKENYCFLIVVVVTMVVATAISVMTHKTKKSLPKYGRERRGKKYFTVISVRDELL